MEKMGYPISKTIINISLQELEYYGYIDSLNIMLREYSEAVHSLSEIEKILLQKSIKELNRVLEPGWESLNLSSLGIQDFITVCKKKINDFRDIKKNVQKHAGNIEDFVKAIEEAQILRDFDFEAKKDQKETLYNPMEFLSHFDEHMKRIVSEIVEKYNMIGS